MAIEPLAGHAERADDDGRAVGVELLESLLSGQAACLVERVLEGLLEVEHRGVVGDGDLEGEPGLGPFDDLGGHGRLLGPWEEKRAGVYT